MVGVRFTDPKLTGTGYDKTPDIPDIVVSRSVPVALKAVGELKVPQTGDHCLKNLVISE